jgi:hypothetical protein
VVNHDCKSLCTTFPGAHGTNTSAIAEVFSEFLGIDNIDLDVHGFDAAGPTGNLYAVRHYDTADELRSEVVDARLWRHSLPLLKRGRSAARTEDRALQPQPRVQTSSLTSTARGVADHAPPSNPRDRFPSRPHL